MAENAIHGVFLSEDFDLGALYDDALKAEAADVVVHRPEDVSDPGQIQFAMCWEPGPQAFEPYPNIKMAMSIGAGVDALLSHPGLAPEVAIARVRDPHQAELMAGYAVHEVLHYERGFDAMMQSAQAGDWCPLPMRAPHSVTIAVLGNGTMGQAVIDGLNVLGFSLRVACRSEPISPLDGVTYFHGPEAVTNAAAGADYLINVLPLTAATENVLNHALFGRMRPGARLIQIGRGEHLDEDDLIRAIDQGQLAGATLDVFRTEPLPKEHPFWSDSRLRLTPHIASDSTADVVAQQAVQSARALRDGHPIPLGIARAQGY